MYYVFAYYNNLCRQHNYFFIFFIFFCFYACVLCLCGDIKFVKFDVFVFIPLVDKFNVTLILNSRFFKSMQFKIFMHRELICSEESLILNFFNLIELTFYRVKVCSVPTRYPMCLSHHIWWQT